MMMKMSCLEYLFNKKRTKQIVSRQLGCCRVAVSGRCEECLRDLTLLECRETFIFILLCYTSNEQPLQLRSFVKNSTGVVIEREAMQTLEGSESSSFLFSSSLLFLSLLANIKGRRTKTAPRAKKKFPEIITQPLAARSYDVKSNKTAVNCE